MQFHPGAKPEFVRHVESRLAHLRDGLSAALPPGLSSLTLEIGCGHGHFLARYAQAHPERYCLGVDLLKDRLERAAKKRDRAGLENLHFFKAEAAEFLETLPFGVSIESVFLLFPDPWPKKRHHKNRLVRPDFLSALARRMVAGGRLYFRTDHAEYFESGRAIIVEHPDWQLEPDAAWPFEEATVFQLKADSFNSLVATVRGHPS
jgi:tRNA (guanine-N7-)-methyltransferase